MSMTGNTKHMPMLEATAPDSFHAQGDALPVIAVGNGNGQRSSENYTGEQRHRWQHGHILAFLLHAHGCATAAQYYD